MRARNYGSPTSIICTRQGKARLFAPQWKIKATCHHLRLVLADQPELKQIDQVLVKQTHAAATTFILEAVKQSADSSSIR